MDFLTLETLRSGHPAWRLLRADLAPLVASFLHRVFLKPNVRQMLESDLVRHLEDDLFRLRRELGENRLARHVAEVLLHELVHGQRTMTPDTAIRCARRFGIEVGCWLTQQAAWDSFQAWKRQSPPVSHFLVGRNISIS